MSFPAVTFSEFTHYTHTVQRKAHYATHQSRHIYFVLHFAYSKFSCSAKTCLGECSNTNHTIHPLTKQDNITQHNVVQNVPSHHNTTARQHKTSHETGKQRTTRRNTAQHKTAQDILFPNIRGREGRKGGRSGGVIETKIGGRDGPRDTEFSGPTGASWGQGRGACQVRCFSPPSRECRREREGNM